MVFLDTGFFIAYKNKRDIYHNHAQHIAAQILNGLMLKPYTCDYVLDEAVNVPRIGRSFKGMKGSERFRISCEIGETILNDKYWNLRIVREGHVKNCFKKYSEHPEINMSFTDWIVGNMALDTGHKTVVTSDAKHFGKVAKIFELPKPIYLMKNEDFDTLKDEVLRKKAKPEELIYGEVTEA